MLPGSLDLLEALVVFLRFLHELQSVELVHPLYASTIFQSSYLVELVLQFLPRHFLQPLLPNLSGEQR